MVAGRSRRTPKLAARLLSDSSHLSDEVVTITLEPSMFPLVWAKFRVSELYA